MDQAKKRSNLNTEKIAEIISIPNSEIFFEKKTKDELQISCKYDWLVNNITEKVKLRNKI